MESKSSRPNDPLWDDMASMEVSLMKGAAYDLTFTGDGESYALVIDSDLLNHTCKWTSADQMTLKVTEAFTNIIKC